MPADVRKQLERTVKDGQKTLHSAITEVQKRLDRTARQADVDMVMKRLEGLSKQVRNLASSVTSPPATARPARRKPATRKSAAAAKPAARKPAARVSAKRKPARRAAPKSSTPTTPPSPDPNDAGAF